MKQDINKKKRKTQEILQILKPAMPAPKQGSKKPGASPEALADELFSKPKKKSKKKKKENTDDEFVQGQESTSVTGDE